MTEVLDAQWISEYTRLAGYASEADSNMRARNLADQETAFTQGDVHNPDLRPTVDPERIARDDANLAGLAERIQESEPNQVVVDAYVPRIAELRSKLAMLNAAAAGDTAGFVAANVAVYGEPDPNQLHVGLAHIHGYAEQAAASSNSAVREAAWQVRDELPPAGEVMPVWPSADEFTMVQGLYSDFYDGMMAGIELPSMFGSEVSFPAARQAMRNLGFDYDVVPQRAGMATMSVNHTTREFKIPLDAHYTALRFAALLGHELRVHIEEAKNGEAQALQLLSSGLRGALRGSEGKAVIPEQVVYPDLPAFLDTPRYFTLAGRQVTVGLARGADGNGPRDFREVFTIMQAVNLLEKLVADPSDVVAATTTAQRKTWQQLAVRALCGWTGRGAAAHKEIVYAEGNAGALRALAATPALFPYLHIGKYDISRTEHLSVMQRIGAIPASLLQRR